MASEPQIDSRWSYHLTSTPGLYEYSDGDRTIGVSMIGNADNHRLRAAILCALNDPPAPQVFQGAGRAFIDQWCGTWWYSDRLGHAPNHVHQCIGMEHPDTVAHACRCGAIHPTAGGEG